MALLLVVAAGFGATATSAATEAVPRQLVATWTSTGKVLTIKANGRAVLKFGQESIPETVSGTGTRVTFGPAGLCAGKGTYSWKLSARKVTMRPISEACGIRRNLLQTTWTRK